MDWTSMSSSYLLDAGWFFFAVWGGVLVFVSVKAFGSDFYETPERPNRARR